MKNSKIKLIIFDFNGVTVIGSHKDTMRILGRRYGYKPKELYKVFYTKYHNLVAVKEISLKESWEKPLKQFNISLTWKQAVRLHNSIPKINKSVVKLANHLRKKYKCIVVSKNVKQYWEFYKKKLKFQKYFDEIINLQDYKLPKSSPKTIRFICHRHKVRPQEIVYSDDQKQNLLAPKKMGVRTILYKNFKQFKRDLYKYLK